MKLNTNSNVYTFVYMTIVVIIVAVLLALANQALKPRQDANILLDKQKQILGALKVDFSQADPAEVYYTLINDTLTYGEAEVYVANLNGAVKYVLPLSGKGLWGGIGGYLALDEDKNTIYGVNFNHEGETPGLGAKIVELPFRESFEGKHIRNAEGQVVSVAVLKAGTRAEGQEQVDAISGATITSTGVSTMLAEELINNYVEFLTGEAGPTAESDPTAEGGLTGEAGQFITEE
jgi:Na+-transporting NADH:ubiquinone oxidoreductase subunit C